MLNDLVDEENFANEQANELGDPIGALDSNKQEEFKTIQDKTDEKYLNYATRKETLIKNVTDASGIAFGKESTVLQSTVFEVTQALETAQSSFN